MSIIEAMANEAKAGPGIQNVFRQYLRADSLNFGVLEADQEQLFVTQEIILASDYVIASAVDDHAGYVEKGQKGFGVKGQMGIDIVLKERCDRWPDHCPASLMLGDNWQYT